MSCLVEVHIRYTIYTTTTLLRVYYRYTYPTAILHLSYSYPTSILQLDIIRSRYYKRFTHININLISTISTVIDSTYTNNQVCIQDAEMLLLFMK